MNGLSFTSSCAAIAFCAAFWCTVLSSGSIPNLLNVLNSAVFGFMLVLFLVRKDKTSNNNK